ncbi:MAG: signal peptidase I [Chloroflexi bacterium]|nr:signal peptidase I [Chloroflexota bacterium]
MTPENLPSQTSAHLVSDPSQAYGLTLLDVLDEPLHSKPVLARLRHVLREILETVALAAVIWLMINLTTARYIVEGRSMEPNLHPGQYLIVLRAELAYAVAPPQRGDIVVFHFPNSLTDDYVKRIIGLPGELVSIEGGRVHIDGALIDEPYLGNLPRTDQSWTVPEGHYFVMGDNRPGSHDSRSWGALAEERIVGKAWISYWPSTEWGIIPRPIYGGEGD